MEKIKFDHYLFEKYNLSKLKMFKLKFVLIIQNNFFFIVLLANFFYTYIQSYYIFPFKILKPELSSLYKIFPDYTKEEIYLSYLNSVTMYTYIKSENSNIYELIFNVCEKCSFQTNQLCITNYKSNIFDNFEHKNENVLNVINKIMDTSPKEECTNIKIGLALPGWQGANKCIFIDNEIKNNDNSVNTSSFYFKFYKEKESKLKGFDGELIMGAEPHLIDPIKYKENDFMTVYNHLNDYYYNYDLWDGKLVNYSFVFDKVYFYINNNKTEENIFYINVTDSNEGAIDFEIGLNKCPFSFYVLIKQSFFEQYIKSKVCEEITLLGGYFGILCDKTKIKKEEFKEYFPTLYFHNVNLNYEFILDYNDLFIENEETIYFTLISRNEILNNWRFGHIFLKKYFLIFNRDKKSIGYYVHIKNDDPSDDKKEEGGGKKISTGIIILIVAIVLLIIEGIAAFVCIKKCNYCSNRKKRANELLDDNFEYSTVNGQEKDEKVIN